MLIDHLNQQLRERRGQGLWRERWIAESCCAPRQRAGHEGLPVRELLTFCSNDYLGLAAHPAVISALAEGAALYGAGSGASHLVSGHSRAHAMLEEALAATQRDSIPGCRAITFSTGYMANLALMAALGGTGATLFTDKLNHASLIDGALLSRAEVQRYPHGRIDILSERLARCASALKLIVTDAVFSMDGDIAPLPQLLDLAEQYDAWIVIDDAHGFGVLGPQGRGSLAHYGLRSERFILMGTLGKALGVAGAFVAAHPTVIEWLVQTARPYIYTTATPPALAHALLASLAITLGAEGDQRRAHLHTLVGRLRSSLGELLQAQPLGGARLMDSSTPIQPLVVGHNDRALALAATLDAQGLRVPAIRPPTVPAGTARLRITLSAAHTTADVDRLCGALDPALRGAE